MSAGSAAAPSKILLVDGTNSLYRAFFAIPPLRAPDGTPTNAAYGFINMLVKVIREGPIEKPSPRISRSSFRSFANSSTRTGSPSFRCRTSRPMT